MTMTSKLFTSKFEVEERQMPTNFYLEITLRFPIIITNCEKRFLTCQQHCSTLRVVTPIWPPLASIMHARCVIQLISFQISDYIALYNNASISSNLIGLELCVIKV